MRSVVVPCEEQIVKESLDRVLGSSLVGEVIAIDDARTTGVKSTPIQLRVRPGRQLALRRHVATTPRFARTLVGEVSVWILQ